MFSYYDGSRGGLREVWRSVVWAVGDGVGVPGWWEWRQCCVGCCWTVLSFYLQPLRCITDQSVDRKAQTLLLYLKTLIPRTSVGQYSFEGKHNSREDRKPRLGRTIQWAFAVSFEQQWHYFAQELNEWILLVKCGTYSLSTWRVGTTWPPDHYWRAVIRLVWCYL